MTVLPLITRPIDNTAISAYMTCPREYYYSMLRHRRPISKSPPLHFGSAWHEALAAHYRGGTLEDATRSVINFWGDGHRAEGSDYRTAPRCIMDFEQYLRHYPVDADRATTVGYPDAPLVEIATEIGGTDLSFDYAGKLDRIITQGGLGYVEDHKTTSRLDKHYFSQFELSNQMMGYTWMAQQFAPSIETVGVRINLSHVLTKKTEFHRQTITFTKTQLSGWARNMDSWYHRLLDDYMRLHLTNGGSPDELEIGTDIAAWLMRQEAFPSHYGDNGCSRKFGVCTYNRVCGSSPRIRERILEQDFELSPWNPLTADDEEESKP